MLDFITFHFIEQGDSAGLFIKPGAKDRKSEWWQVIRHKLLLKTIFTVKVQNKRNYVHS